METKPVHEFLYDEDNYLEWSVRVKTHLMAEDLWDIVEATNEPPTPENEAAFKAWRKMNAMALRVIQSSLGPDIFSDIMEITSARIAWETLAEKYKPNCPDPSSSMASVPLEEYNLDSNTKSGTIQISSDIREITSDRMASVPLEEDKLDSSTKPGISLSVSFILCV
ncbi:uncharacterized protein LOC142615634 [Castanea sativa]|uniref:uncharacterized protein LOC142615634 n=1 Tax=Castanea sativa TaxID=21020 RepID=UPI003F650C46